MKQHLILLHETMRVNKVVLTCSLRSQVRVRTDNVEADAGGESRLASVGHHEPSDTRVRDDEVDVPGDHGFVALAGDSTGEGAEQSSEGASESLMERQHLWMWQR